MADEKPGATQQAAQTVVNKLNAGAQNTTITNQSTVANAPGNVAGGNVGITLPPARRTRRLFGQQQQSSALRPSRTSPRPSPRQRKTMRSSKL